LKPLITPKYFYFCIFFMLITFMGTAQEKLAPDVYLVRFGDKDNNTYQLSVPSGFLSSRAILRRQRQGIPIRENDLPVSRMYTDSLQKLGFTVLNCSKWLNAASVETTNSTLLEKLQEISFIKILQKNNKLTPTRLSARKYSPTVSAEKSGSGEYYGAAYSQVTIHHGEFLHEKGLRGQDMLIAVLDAGFNNARNMSCLDSLWLENRVILSRDTYGNTGNLFNGEEHGSMVLSILAATEPGYLVGTAPQASYLLLRSEDATTETNGDLREYLIEEFNWVVAAELADSIGADIISSSLGYSTFNDTSMNHTYEDMDGCTTLVSKGASVASSKGMIVVVSAGNEGADSWKYIIVPADADSILAVGATDSNRKRAGFSSVGPTADNRIKPDVMAIGKGTAVQTSSNTIGRVNGTSFSAPVIAGLTACLWQAAPDKGNINIINTIKRYSSQYALPDNYMGYGIPDFRKAYYALLLNEDVIADDKMNVWPIPFTDEFQIEIPASEESSLVLSIFDYTGRKVFEKQETITPQIANIIVVQELALFASGVYIVKVSLGTGTSEQKILKL
jgi:serine protease AprX